MTLDEEIRLAKEEKKLNKKVNALMESLEISDDEDALLRLKYCETAETLREFDYKKNIFESYKESKNYKKINELNETVNFAKEKIYSTDINVVTEGYRELAKVYLSLNEVEQLSFFPEKKEVRRPDGSEPPERKTKLNLPKPKPTDIKKPEKREISK